MVETFSGQTTEFNMAIATLQRIHENFMKINYSMVMEDWKVAKSFLDSNWKEVDCYLLEMPKEFREEFYKHKEELEKLMNQYYNQLNLLKINKEIRNLNQSKNLHTRIKNSLDKYDLMIRNVMNKKGMLSIDKEDIHMAVLEE